MNRWDSYPDHREHDLDLDWRERRHLIAGFAVVAVFLFLVCLAGGVS